MTGLVLHQRVVKTRLILNIGRDAGITDVAVFAFRGSDRVRPS